MTAQRLPADRPLLRRRSSRSRSRSARYMARVYEGEPIAARAGARPARAPRLPRSPASTPDAGDDAGRRTRSRCCSSTSSASLVVYALQRLQGVLPLNPQGFGAPSPDSSFNTAVSFATNTNWQSYGGETTMSYLTQMLGARPCRTSSRAATGMAVLVALIRGIRAQDDRDASATSGSTSTRSTLYILLPLSLVLALVLVSQGVVQTFRAYADASPLLQPTKDADGKAVTEQVLAARARPPRRSRSSSSARTAAASSTPTPRIRSRTRRRSRTSSRCSRSSLISGGALLHVRQDGRRHAPGLGGPRGDARRSSCRCSCCASRRSRPATRRSRRSASTRRASALQPGGNMEGKEVRFGIAQLGALGDGDDRRLERRRQRDARLVHAARRPRAAVADPARRGHLRRRRRRACTACSIFAIVAVFVAGLMVGRTPEYLGKKIEAYEMKMASLAILIPPLVVLVGTAIAVLGRRRTATRRQGVADQPGAARLHRDPLRLLVGRRTTTAAPSAGSTRQHAASTTLTLGLAMFFGRFWLDRSRCSRSPARSPRRRSSRRAPARCRRTRRSSSCCSSARSSSSAR